jgi:hypothetical protein
MGTGVAAAVDPAFGRRQRAEGKVHGADQGLARHATGAVARLFT